MAVIGSGLTIVKDGLIGAREREYVSQDESSFSCRYTQGDVEGKSKAKGIKGVTDIEDRRSFLWSRMG